MKLPSNYIHLSLFYPLETRDDKITLLDLPVVKMLSKSDWFHPIFSIIKVPTKTGWQLYPFFDLSTLSISSLSLILSHGTSYIITSSH